MTVIETKKGISPNAIEKLYEFLVDMNNFEALMPKDKIEKWSSTTEQCEFTIKGMARIGLKRVDQTSPTSIKIGSFGKVPFDFSLDIELKPVDDNHTETQMIFNGDINAFMKMMVEKPLTNFFNMLVDKAAELNL